MPGRAEDTSSHTIGFVLLDQVMEWGLKRPAKQFFFVDE